MTRVREGEMFKGTISRLGQHGVFVSFGKDLEGLVHRSRIPGDISSKTINEQYRLGQRMAVRVVSFVEDEGIRLQGLEHPS